MWTRAELKQQAKQVMKTQYWKMLVASLVLALLTGTFVSLFLDFYDIFFGFEQSVEMYESAEAMVMSYRPFVLVFIVSIVYAIFVVEPLSVGFMKYFINARFTQASYSDLFYAFRNHYWNHVKILFLMNLKILLWTCVFFVPGVIKAYEYFMVRYILAEDADVDAKTVFALSKKLTDSMKFDIFVLVLSFLGWNFLGLLACGVGSIFVIPYEQASYTELYFKLKEIQGVSIGFELPPTPDK